MRAVTRPASAAMTRRSASVKAPQRLPDRRTSTR